MTKNDDIKALLDDVRKQRELLEKKEEKINKREKELVEKLAKVSGLTKDEAEKELILELDKLITILTEAKNAIALTYEVKVPEMEQIRIEKNGL